jgi:hypothetical protein
MNDCEWDMTASSVETALEQGWQFYDTVGNRTMEPVWHGKAVSPDGVAYEVLELMNTKRRFPFARFHGPKIAVYCRDYKEARPAAYQGGI